MDTWVLATYDDDGDDDDDDDDYIAILGSGKYEFCTKFFKTPPII